MQRYGFDLAPQSRGARGSDAGIVALGIVNVGGRRTRLDELDELGPERLFKTSHVINESESESRGDPLLSWRNWVFRRPESPGRCWSGSGRLREPRCRRAPYRKYVAVVLRDCSVRVACVRDACRCSRAASRIRGAWPSSREARPPRTREPQRIDAIKLSIAFITDPAGVYIELTEGLDDVR